MVHPRQSTLIILSLAVVAAGAQCAVATGRQDATTTNGLISYLAPVDGGAVDENDALFGISPGQAMPIQLGPALGAAGNVFGPVWSPNGFYLGYGLVGPAGPNLWALHPDLASKPPADPVTVRAFPSSSLWPVFAWAPDSRTFAFTRIVGDFDWELDQFDPATGKETTLYATHQGDHPVCYGEGPIPVGAAAYLPSGSELVLAEEYPIDCNAMTVQTRLLFLKTNGGGTVRSITLTGMLVYAMALSRDGSMVLTSEYPFSEIVGATTDCLPGSLVERSVATGTILRSIPLASPSLGVAFSPDGAQVLYDVHDGSVCDHATLVRAPITLEPATIVARNAIYPSWQPVLPAGDSAADDDCEHQASTETPCPQCPNITVAPEQLTQAVTGHDYSEQLHGILGQAPYSFSTAGPLPAGLTLSPGGLLSGRVTAPAGVYPINFNVVDARGCQGTNLSLELYGTTPNIFPQGFTLLLHVDASPGASGSSSDARRAAVERAAVASGSRQIEVTFRRWQLDDEGVVTSRPGSVVSLCSSRALVAFKLDGYAAGAKRGQRFSVTWSVDDRVRRAFSYRWAETGSYPISLLLGNLDGLPRGRWSLSVQGGTVGSSQLTLDSRSC